MKEVVATTLLELQDMQSSNQIITTDIPTPNIIAGRMPFLSPNQQCQRALKEDGDSDKEQCNNALNQN